MLEAKLEQGISGIAQQQPEMDCGATLTLRTKVQHPTLRISSSKRETEI